MAVLASAALIAGCGGDDGGGDETSSEARDEFIAQADQLCMTASEEIGAETTKRFGADGAADDQAIIDLFDEVTIPELRKSFDGIGELTPPPGDEEEVQEILDAADQALDESAEDPKILAKPIGQGNPFEETNELLQAYGFEFCGGGNA